jgi:serine protease Do
VALIKIDATKLTVLKLGDSSRVRVGAQVLAVGSPFAFENTVSAGIVSATPHALTDGSNFPFFQTTVAVNPDNSGGPVFNRAGATNQQPRTSGSNSSGYVLSVAAALFDGRAH